MTKKAVEDAARLLSCPLGVSSSLVDLFEGGFTADQWNHIQFLHMVYLKSDPAVLSGVKCGCS